MTKYTDTDNESRDELCDRIYVLESALERIAVGGLSDQEMVEIAAEALDPNEATARDEAERAERKLVRDMPRRVPPSWHMRHAR